jgi:hypothetical protein
MPPQGMLGNTARRLGGCGEPNSAVLGLRALRGITAEGVAVAVDNRAQSQPQCVVGASLDGEVACSRYLLVDRSALPAERFAKGLCYWNRASSVAAGTGEFLGWGGSPVS